MNFRSKKIISIYLVLILILGYIYINNKSTELRDQTILWVESKGGTLEYGYSSRIEGLPNFLKNIFKILAKKHVIMVDIDSTKLKNISPLKNFEELRLLDLSYSGITDINPLKDLTELVDIKLSDTDVVDISALASLKKLKTLNLTNTNVSKERREALKQKLENLTIIDKTIQLTKEIKN